MSITGEPGRPPVKCGVPVADFAAGLYGAFAVSAALAQVRAGGLGMHIDVPMLEFGNLHSSKFTSVDAEAFVKNWKIVEHVSDTATGFSGTLFECLRTDPSAGCSMNDESECHELPPSFCGVT